MSLLRKSKYTHYRQSDSNDCGPTCVKIVGSFYGKRLSSDKLKGKAVLSEKGASLKNLSRSAEVAGFETLSAKTDFDSLIKDAELPFIVHWQDNHYVVVTKITHKHVTISDPARGKRILSRKGFLKGWHNADELPTTSQEGIVLFLKPTEAFYEQADEPDRKVTIWFYVKYLKPYKKLLFQLLIGLLIGSLFSLLMPILTRTLIDRGVNGKDLNMVYLVLAGQLMLFFGKTSIDLIRSWIILHFSTRVDISIISDFLGKLMRLPIAFFDKQHVGDVLQRMRDHTRVKMFMTGAPLNILFSVFNLIILSFVMLNYSLKVYLVFLVGSIAYIVWVILFLKRRKEIDHERFAESSKNQSKEIQLIQGMQEIKLNSAEVEKRREWQDVQVGLFKISIKSLILEQYQSAGSNFINELKNILITFISAREVIEGDMTLGMMMAITQIIGQMNMPIIQFVGFIRQAQDAKISLERLNEIHEREDEDENKSVLKIPEKASLHFRNMSFKYHEDHPKWVLDGIDLTIEQGKTTAIVGASGSGKTTLLKLLLKFYKPQEGNYLIDDQDSEVISNDTWRRHCGVVMQDGFIFSDSIAKNIAVTGGKIDQDRLREAARLASIDEYIEEQPKGYKTKLGHDGTTLSNGQRQRILIARAIYKNPDYLFFDEATSSLDSNNESIITTNLQEFSKGKTAVVIAHRLSTIVNADKIVVLEKGKVAEQGTHKQLLEKRGLYHKLVKNQLDLN